jgi:hypothetical protein
MIESAVVIEGRPLYTTLPPGIAKNGHQLFFGGVLWSNKLG